MRGMKWFAAALIAAAALLAAAATAGAASLPAGTTSSQVGRDAFTGVWVGIENPIGDGSTDVMAISGPNAGGARNWQYYETNASGYCSPGGGGPLSASGTARAVGNTLTVTVTFARCANGLPGAFQTPFEIAMTATGDGHIDWSGVIFSRAGSGA